MVNKGVIVVGSLVIGGVLIFGLTRKAEAVPPPGGWSCPYCPQSFGTYEELVQHIQSAHPGERIPLPIEWE